MPMDFRELNIRSELADSSPHNHNYVEAGYCHFGFGIFLLGAEIHPFRSGDAIFTSGSEVHLLMNGGPAESRWSFSTLEPSEMLDGVLSDVPFFYSNTVMSGRAHPEIAGLIRDLLLARKNGNPEYRNETRALLWLILIRLRKCFPKPEKTPSAFRRLLPSLHYMIGNSAMPLKVSKLALLCGLSESNFRKTFHSAAGCSPREYFLRLRMCLAGIRLSETENEISRISENSGFGNLSNFNRRFLEFYGVSPSKYRKKYQCR